MKIQLILTEASKLESIKIIDGQLICCTDLSAYFDIEDSRIRLGDCVQYRDLEALNKAPNPSIKRIYVTTEIPSVYRWDTNGKFTQVTTVDQILTLISAANELTPVTLSSSGKRRAPRTLAQYVYMKDGRNLEEALLNVKEQNEQVKIFCKMNVVLANYNNQKIFNIPFPISNYDLKKYPMVVITKYGVVDQNQFTMSVNQIIFSIDYPELDKNDEVVFIFHYSMKLDGLIDAHTINGTPLYAGTSRPAQPVEGTIWIDTASGTVQQYINNGWFNVINNPNSIDIGILSARSHYNLTTTNDIVPIGINNFNPDKDVIFVFRNSVYMTLDVDYTISSDNTAIKAPIGVQWTATEEMPFYFNFVVLKGFNKGNQSDQLPMEQLQYIAKELSQLQEELDDVKNSMDAATVNGTPFYVSSQEPLDSTPGAVWIDTVSGRIKELINGAWRTIMENGSLCGGVSIDKGVFTLQTANSTVPITAAIYDKSVDTMMVYQNGIYLEENVDYKVAANSKNIISLDGEWDGSQYPIIFDFIVFHSTSAPEGGPKTLDTNTVPGSIDPMQIVKLHGTVTSKNISNFEMDTKLNNLSFATLVFKNGECLNKSKDYIISDAVITVDSDILKVGDVINAIVFDMPNNSEAIKALSSRFFNVANPYLVLKDYTLTGKTSIVDTGIPDFEAKDALMVFQNGEFLTEGIDYFIEGSYINAITPWDGSVNPIYFEFVVVNNSAIYTFDVKKATEQVSINFIYNEATMTPLLYNQGKLLVLGEDYALAGDTLNNLKGTWANTTLILVMMVNNKSKTITIDLDSLNELISTKVKEALSK